MNVLTGECTLNMSMAFSCNGQSSKEIKVTCTEDKQMRILASNIQVNSTRITKQLDQELELGNSWAVRLKKEPGKMVRNMEFVSITIFN